MGIGERQIQLGAALGVDKLRIPSLPRISKSCGCSGRIQRQIHDQPDGPARSVYRHARWPQPFDISEFFPDAAALAIYRSQIGKMNASQSSELTQFATDVLAGLSATPKQLSSKYFYDDEGSRLFQEIMKLPEYYLTGCEQEIFETQTDEIFRAFANGDNAFDLIELGAGDGTKTAVLVDHFLKRNADISYSPIDISQEALDALTEKFNVEFPALKMNAMNGDYFKILGSLKNGGGRRKVLLFLGSNIGNFSREQSVTFFRSLRAVMNEN